MSPTDPADPATIDCSTACIQGCVLGDRCPNQEFRQQASHFIREKSLDEMLAIAEAALRKKMMAPPQWIYPEEGIPEDDRS